MEQDHHHEYLGMDLDHSTPGYGQKISMIPYVTKIIDEFLERIGMATTSTQAADHLFNFRDPKDAKLLPEDQMVQCHLLWHNCYSLVIEHKGTYIWQLYF